MNATPARRDSGDRAAGFTLIELLVVLVIVGVVMMVVTISINPRSSADRLHTESQRLTALVQGAADDAVLYGRQIGLKLGPHGYEFLRLGDNGWQPIADRDSPLRPRRLDPDIRLHRIGKANDGAQPMLYEIDPTAPPPDDPDNAGANGANGDNAQQQGNAGPRPDAVFLSSGEFIPFTLELSADGVSERYDLRGDAGGRLALRRIGGSG